MGILDGKTAAKNRPATIEKIALWGDA